jgi:acyl-CoA thioester hydrolase
MSESEPFLGAFRKGVHVFPLRVYYEDTDAGGVVYYANYLRFAERARTELLRNLGVEQSRLAADGGILFAVRKCCADFLRPAHLDDRLEVRTRILEISGATVEAEQQVWREDDELVRLTVRLACLSTSRSGRPARLPASLRQSLESVCSSDR